MAYRSLHNPFLTFLVFSLAMLNFPSLEFFKKFIYSFHLLLAVVGLHWCVGAFSSCGAQVSLFVEHGDWGMQFISCHAWAQQLWFLGSSAPARQLRSMSFVALRHVGTSRIAIKPMSSSLTDGFLFTEPPGKPSHPQNFPTLIPECSCLSGFSHFQFL